MALPVAVQRQAEEAKRLEEQLVAEHAAETTDTPASTDAPVEGSEPEAAAAETVIEKPATETETVVTDDKPVEEDWKAKYESLSKDFETLTRKYNTLDGKYLAEVPRQAEAIRALKIENNTLHKLLEKAPTSPAQEEVSTKKKMKEKFAQQFPDMATAIEEMIEEKAGKSVQEVSEKVSKVEERVAANDGESFMRGLKKGVADAGGDLAVLDADPDFLAWLDQRVKGTTFTRQQLLNRAVQTLDVSSAVELFTDYMETTGKPAEKKAETPASKRDVKTFAAPPASLKSEAPADSTKTKYTKTEVLKYYTNKAKNTTGLTPEQIIAKDKDIEMAALEGRISED